MPQFACNCRSAGTQCVSAETKLAMLRRKMEGGSRAAIEDLRRQEQDLLSLAQIEVRSLQRALLRCWPSLLSVAGVCSSRCLYLPLLLAGV